MQESNGNQALRMENLKPIKYEKDFSYIVRSKLKQLGFDVWKFERCGTGCPDFLVTSPHSILSFYIELKGHGTRYSAQKRTAQENFAKRYRSGGNIVLRLTPKSEGWEEVLEDFGHCAQKLSEYINLAQYLTPTTVERLTQMR